jgi:hypothetical protein
MADQVATAKEQLQRARDVQAADFWQGHIIRGNAQREHEQQTTARETAVETPRQQRLTR